jgi:hypothetical protein
MAVSAVNKIAVQEVLVPSNEEFLALSSRLDATDTSLVHRIGLIEATLAPPVPNAFIDNFVTAYNLISEGQQSPDGKWKAKYLSGGVIESKAGVMHMAPKAVTASNQTSAPQLNSVKVFDNFIMDVDMRTNKQIRTGSPPNTWEAAWIIIRFTNENPKSNHHYYFVIKTNGCEFGKKDNPKDDPTLEKQIFLHTTTEPKLKIGTTNHIRIIADGFKFSISVDGVVVVDMIDPQVNYKELMAKGEICLYAEDADVVFDNINVMPNIH